MTRQLRASETNVRRTAATLIQPKTQRAFLMDTYPGSTAQGSARVVLVSLSDPQLGARGVTLRARVSAGLSTDPVAVGTPVTIKTYHGQAEIVSFG